MERSTDRHEFEDLRRRIQRQWVGVGIAVVLVLLVALWNVSFLRGQSRLRTGLDAIEAAHDSLRAEQASARERERAIARELSELADLRALGAEVRSKAPAASVAAIRARLDELSLRVRALDSARTSERFLPANRGPEALIDEPSVPRIAADTSHRRHSQPGTAPARTHSTIRSK